MANGRACESLPGVNTSYFDEDFLYEIETLVVLTHPGQTYALQFLSQCVLFQTYSPKGVPLRYVFSKSPTLSTVPWRRLQCLSPRFIRTRPAERSVIM